MRVWPGRPYPLGATFDGRGVNFEQKAFFEFVRALVRLKLEEPVLHPPKFFQGRPIRGLEIKDVVFLEPSGEEMNDAAWNSAFVKCLGVHLPGDAIAEVDEQGERLVGNTVLILLNAHHDAIAFKLPVYQPDRPWQVVFDTFEQNNTPLKEFAPAADYRLQGRSVAVLRVEKEKPQQTAPIIPSAE